MTEQRKWPDSWEWADKEIPATEAEAAAMAAKIEDRLRKTEAAHTLKPSERGPTNEEIIAEAKRISDLEWEGNEEYADFFGPLLFRLQADQSWFKPEPELLEVTQADRDLWKYLLDAPKSKCSMMDTCDPATAELQAIARYRIEAFAKRDNELTEGKADQSWFKPEPEVDEATRVTREVLAADAKEQSLYQMAEMYLKGDVDGNLSFQAAREVIAEALVVPFDVEKAARWIFDNSDGWTEDAKANAQKLAEYALRGKQ